MHMVYRIVNEVNKCARCEIWLQCHEGKIRCRIQISRFWHSKRANDPPKKKIAKAMTVAMQEECIRLTEKQTIAEKNKTNN